MSDLPVHLLVFWSEKRSPAEEEEGRQGILSVFIFFFPLSRRGLGKVTGAINPLAGDSLHPLPGSSGSPGWVSSVCMCLGKGVGGGCVVVVFLALVAARRESERASERQSGESERAREREEPRSRFRGSTFRRNRCCRNTHGQRKEVIASKGGNLHRRLDSQEFMRGIIGSMRWGLFCIG